MFFSAYRVYSFAVSEIYCTLYAAMWLSGKTNLNCGSSTNVEVAEKGLQTYQIILLKYV